MVGAAANAFLFISVLVAFVITSALVAAHAARCFLVVLVETAAGNDAVQWPDESFLDWLRGTIYLVGFLGVCLVPAGLFTRFFGDVWLPDRPGLRFVLLAGTGIWLLTPLGIVVVM